MDYRAYENRSGMHRRRFRCIAHDAQRYVERRQPAAAAATPATRPLELKLDVRIIVGKRLRPKRELLKGDRYFYPGREQNTMFKSFVRRYIEFIVAYTFRPFPSQPASGSAASIRKDDAPLY